MGIFESIMHGDADAVERLLASDKKLANAKSQQDRRPLHVAAELGSMAMVELLLGRGAKVNAIDRSGRTALTAACWNGHRDVALRLKAAGADPNLLKAKKTPALLDAIERGDWRGAVLLTEVGADARVEFTQFGRLTTPLHELVRQAWRPGAIEAARNLIAAGADSNEKGHDDETPVHHAARNCRIELMELFLENGGDLEARDNSGATVLFFSLLEARLKMIRLLLDHGARPDLKRDAGKTPLDDAIELRHKYAARLLAERTGQKRMLEFPEGIVPRELGNACAFGDVDDVRMILSDDPSLIDTRHRLGVNDTLTPLHVAASRQDVEVARVLLEFKADVKALDRFQRTPLHEAAESNSVEVAKVLIAAGADLEVADHVDRTPLNDAINYHRPEMVKLLIEAGANIRRMGTQPHKPPRTPLQQAREERPVSSNLQAREAEQRAIEQIVKTLEAAGAP